MSRANRHVNKQHNARQSKRAQNNQRFNQLGPRAKGGPMAPKKDTTPDAPAATMTMDAEVVSATDVPAQGLGGKASETASKLVDNVCNYVSTPTGKRVVFYGAVGLFVAYFTYKKFFSDKPAAAVSETPNV